ncbi:plastocyanin/azurin family copper-binding protein [Streptomyces sp. 900105755]|uniref:plastocyanin/azurin family copper-binding protein n=1 Tax=Streptomyces sp. 900105755 TaxID=3154389 RepID=UPI00331D4EC3
MNRTHHPPDSRTRGRRSRTAAGPALAAVAAIGTLGLLSACGGPPHSSATHASATHSSATPTMNMPNMNMPASRPSTGRPVSGTAVAIKNFAFAPATLKVPVGTTVTWTNEDTDAHTVTSTGPGGPLHSAALGTHATYSHTFTKPGTFAYLCTIHPFMTATVEVTR